MQLEDAFYAPAATTVLGTDLVQIYVKADHPKGSKVITTKDLLTATIAALPTSAAGLSAGDLYVNTGVLTVV